MPTYSYACTECDNRFDAVQAFTDDALTTCPQCSGRLRKLFNSVGVVFKGSGFYRTDNREASKTSKSEASGSETSAGPEKSAGSDKSSGAEKSSSAEKSSGADKSSSAGTSSSGASTSGSSAPAALSS